MVDNFNMVPYILFMIMIRHISHSLSLTIGSSTRSQSLLTKIRSSSTSSSSHQYYHLKKQTNCKIKSSFLSPFFNHYHHHHHHHHHHGTRASITVLSAVKENRISNDCDCNSSFTNNLKDYDDRKNIIGMKLIHWRGEKTHGNSFPFRHTEFNSSLCTVLNKENLDVQYKEALCMPPYDDTTLDMTVYQRELYQNAMQYVQIFEKNDNNSHNTFNIDNRKWIEASQRCSLIRGVYEIVAVGDTYEELAHDALANKRLNDLLINGINEHATWRVRLRQYGPTATTEQKSRQFGKKMRSPISQEREVVMKLKELLIQLGGQVDLKNANVSLYVLEGLMDLEGNTEKKMLARLLSNGEIGGNRGKFTSIAPSTRLCVTTTPLAAIEAFTMCNLARVREGDRILDPFCGSCTTLLACSMLINNPLLVGIEIAHNGQVNRQNIIDDFNMRNLTLPKSIIRGDAMDESIREQAKAAVGNEPFDCIITDPPYGIREKQESCKDPPLVQLIKCIGQDKVNDKRLLKVGGRLVAFVPNVKGEDVMLSMPSNEELNKAGLELRQMVEQPLNDSLTRWLVEYICIH